MKKYFLLAGIFVTIIGSLLQVQFASAQLATGPSLWKVNSNILQPTNSNWTVQVGSSSSFTNLTVTATSTLGIATASQLNGAIYPQYLNLADIGLDIDQAYASTAPATGTVFNIGPGVFPFSHAIVENTVGKNILIKCAPGNATQLVWTGTGTSTVINTSGLLQSNNLHSIGYGVTGCDFEGSGPTNGQTAITLGGSNGADGVLIQDNKFRNFGIGVEKNNNVYGEIIDRNNFNNNLQALLQDATSDSGEGGKFTNNVIADCSPGTNNYAQACVDFHKLVDNEYVAGHVFDDSWVYFAAGSLLGTLEGNDWEDPLFANFNIPHFPYDLVSATGTNSNLTLVGNLFHQDGTSTTPGYNLAADIYNGPGQNMTLIGNISTRVTNATTLPEFIENHGSFVNENTNNTNNAVTSLYNGTGDVNSPLVVVTSTNDSLLSLNSAGNFGIGTSTAPQTFSLQGTGTADLFNLASSSGISDLVVKSNGSIGINTSTPPYTLEVVANTNSDPLDVASSSGVSLLHVSSAGASVGRIGVAGITSPSVALDVNGTIRSDGTLSNGVGGGIQISLTNNGTIGVLGGVSNNALGIMENNSLHDVFNTSGQLAVATSTTAINADLFVQGISGSLTPILIAATSSGLTDFEISSNNAVGSSSTPPTLSSCSTSPSKNAGADNFGGTITIGTGATTGCVVTFGVPFSAVPSCIVTSETATSTFAYSESASAITVTDVNAAGDKFDYICKGNPN